MTYIQELNEKFTLPGSLMFNQQKNDLIFIHISNQYADAKISLYGAQVISFKPKDEHDILWVSPMSKYEVGKAIRGGIPVCFPWFGPHKSDPARPQHGLARLINWQVTETASLSNGETLVRLELHSSPQTKVYWPYDFSAAMTFTVGKTLTVTLKITNTSRIQFDYSCALHSYYNLSAIEDISIEGLHGARFHKNNEPGDFIQDTTKLKINQIEDRNYYNTEATCIIKDLKFKRKISVAKAGSKVTTVWNPGAVNCARMEDMPNEAYRRFICIEAVNSFDNTICLTPGESHETSAIIGLMD